MQTNRTQKAIERELSNQVSRFLKQAEALKLLDRMDIHSPGDLQGFVCPEQTSPALIEQLIDSKSGSFFGSVGDKIINDALAVEQRGGGFEVILQEMPPRTVIHTESGHIKGFLGDTVAEIELPADILESIVQVLAAPLDHEAPPQHFHRF